MFSQVVTTLLRLTERYAERWLDVQGSHDVPAYGFERLGQPPPLEVNVPRLLEEFGRGRLSVGEAWREALAPETADVVERLAAEAGELATQAASGPPGGELPVFSLPDETWARIVYDVALAHHARSLPVAKLVAALVPLYFGRVASLVLETRDIASDDAEAVVERQARAFELAKPYLVERWRRVAGDGLEVPPARRPAGTRRARTGVR